MTICDRCFKEPAVAETRFCVEREGEQRQWYGPNDLCLECIEEWNTRQVDFYKRTASHGFLVKT